MFHCLETFLSFCRHGTMTAVSSHLNVTQSAVSKRIAHLELYVGKKLLEKSGNRVQLTAAGQQLRAHLQPVFSELKDLLMEEAAEVSGHVPVAMTESVLLSWGAKALFEIQRECKDLTIDIFSDRSTLVIESVRSGESMVAILPGEAENAPDLQADRIGVEEIVIVPAALKPFRLSSKKKLRLFTVHRQHEVSNFIARGMKRWSQRTGITFEIEKTFNTFAMVTEIAVAGWGHGLVSKHLALRMGVPASKLIEFSAPGVFVPISLIGRPTTLAKPLIQTFKASLVSHLPKDIRAGSN